MKAGPGRPQPRSFASDGATPGVKCSSACRPPVTGMSEHRAPTIEELDASFAEFGGTSAIIISSMEFKPMKYVVPGYIAEGATLLAGKPKLGKSWLCLDI